MSLFERFGDRWCHSQAVKEDRTVTTPFLVLQDHAYTRALQTQLIHSLHDVLCVMAPAPSNVYVFVHRLKGYDRRFIEVSYRRMDRKSPELSPSSDWCESLVLCVITANARAHQEMRYPNVTWHISCLFTYLPLNYDTPVLLEYFLSNAYLLHI